jgi:Protein of unknown function (DUF3341)
MSHAPSSPSLYGVMAEFATATELVRATEQARLAGYRRMDAYSPIPIEELSEALDLPRTRLPKLVFIGGLIGGLSGFGLEAWASTIAYPMNIGGRPDLSWPQFIPVTFETTVLGAALSAFIGMWALNKLPQPYHPVFNVPAFERASTDRFFLCIEAADPRFDHAATTAFLKTFHPVGVTDVAP